MPFFSQKPEGLAVPLRHHQICLLFLVPCGNPLRFVIHLSCYFLSAFTVSHFTLCNLYSNILCKPSSYIHRKRPFCPLKTKLFTLCWLPSVSFSFRLSCHCPTISFHLFHFFRHLFSLSVTHKPFPPIQPNRHSDLVRHIYLVLFARNRTEACISLGFYFSVLLFSFFFDLLFQKQKRTLPGVDLQTLPLSVLLLVRLFPRDPIPQVKNTGCLFLVREQKANRKSRRVLFPRTCVCYCFNLFQCFYCVENLCLI